MMPRSTSTSSGGRSAMTDEEREEAYSALNARLMELAPTIYGYDRQSIFAASNRCERTCPVLAGPCFRAGWHGLLLSA